MKMMDREQLWHEAKKMMRFGVIGGTSFLIYAGCYTLLSRVLWTAGSHTLENLIAVIIASVFNFLAHRDWTFAVTHRHPRHLFRYTLVVLTSMGLQTFLFWFGHEYLGWYDAIVAILVAGFMAVYTYLGHRLYTFRHVV